MDWLSISSDGVGVPASRRLAGRARVPSSKSVTHRALMLALLGQREVEVERPLEANDTNLTLAAVRAAGFATSGS